jgi:hypothetical protein
MRIFGLADCSSKCGGDGELGAERMTAVESCAIEIHPIACSYLLSGRRNSPQIFRAESSLMRIEDLVVSASDSVCDCHFKNGR